MDYDADGDLDILSGSYTGEVYYFERTDEGEFIQGRYLLDSDGAPLKTNTSITPEAFDMDADGDLDLIIGTRMEGVFIYENVGTRSQPSWSKNGRAVKTVDGNRVRGSNAHFADWDGDGLRDLVLGSEDGGVIWHRNIGANDSPKYTQKEALVRIKSIDERFEDRSEDDGPNGLGARTKVFVTDWNGDGKNDLLVGDVTWLRRDLAPLTPEQKAEKAALTPAYEAASKKVDEAYEERNSYVGKEGGIPKEVQAKIDAATSAIAPLSRKMASFETSESVTHGWVWLFLQEDSTSAVDPATMPRYGAAASRGPVTLEGTSVRSKGDHHVINIELAMTLDAGWHVYAEVPEGKGYTKTTPTVVLPVGAEMVSDWKTIGAAIPDDANPGTSWFLDRVSFSCKVRLPSSANTDLDLQVEYQVCTEDMCMPPMTLELELPCAPGNS